MGKRVMNPKIASDQFFIKEILGCHLILEEITKNNDDFKSNILWKHFWTKVRVDKFTLSSSCTQILLAKK